MFKKGQSGNPKGRPVGSINAVQQIIRADKKSPEKLVANLDRLIASKDEMISLKATIAKIEFGFGKAAQSFELPEGSKFIIERPHVGS